VEWSRVGYGREEPSKERKVDKGRIEKRRAEQRRRGGPEQTREE
jgi:hypothetical protein